MNEPTVTFGVEKIRYLSMVLGSLAYATKDPVYRHIKSEGERLVKELEGLAAAADPVPEYSGEGPACNARGTAFVDTEAQAHALARSFLRSYPKNPYGTSVGVRPHGEGWAVDWRVFNSD